ncbi:MAG: PAS domain S-box protein [Candidatus Omnitrophica bacterium]|nr:PAS domain S-box protein [Candidatus Omnitrophota bacterium]
MSIKILFIEDNPDHILVTKKILKNTKEDYQVDSINNPEEGIKKIFQQDYDLVLCDYRMPRLSALDILRSIKEDGKDLPFIVVTAAGNEKVAVDLMKEGVSDYIVKDAYYEDILPLVVKKSLEKHRLKKENERVEKELRESEAKYSMLVEQARDGVFIVQDGNFKFINKAMIDITGYSFDEILGMRFFDIVAPESRGVIGEKYDRGMINQRNATFCEFKMRCKDKTIREVELSDNVIQYKGMVAEMGILRDITERKKSEEELRKAYIELKEAQEMLIQSEKMAALGRFSSGFAHELKNPLGIILGGLEFLETILSRETNTEAKIAIQKIKETTLRADTIVQDLLRFARPSELTIETINPNDLIEDNLSLFKYRIPSSNIEIDTQFAKEKILVDVDKMQMGQVIFNVLVNTMEAMPRGGKITIKTYKATLPRPLRKPACAIEIIDTGEGISKENLSRIFEPFFTTKRDRKGTGLGLCIAKAIVENHKGSLMITSELNKGTDVKILLPINKKMEGGR